MALNSTMHLQYASFLMKNKYKELIGEIITWLE